MTNHTIIKSRPSNDISHLTLLDKKSEQALKSYLPDKSTVSALAQFFSAFSDSTRIKIISALALSPMCVGDLAKVLDINQTTLSHQLKLLKSLNVVSCQRQGKVVFYSLQSESAVDSLMCVGAEFI